jgi:uncharacterized protein YidB (DUF937 family)
MSREMPSLTALLGMLALAGYQNRDKLAEIFNSAVSQANIGGKPQGSGDLLGGLSSMLGGAGVGGLLGGGLNELLEQFTKNGLGDAAQSWIGRGPNMEMSPPQVRQAIGPDVLDALAQQTGLSPDELLARLSRELPTAVDRYTPDGRLPARDA